MDSKIFKLDHQDRTMITISLEDRIKYAEKQIEVFESFNSETVSTNEIQKAIKFWKQDIIDAHNTLKKFK